MGRTQAPSCLTPEHSLILLPKTFPRGLRTVADKPQFFGPNLGIHKKKGKGLQQEVWVSQRRIFPLALASTSQGSRILPNRKKSIYIHALMGLGDGPTHCWYHVPCVVVSRHRDSVFRVSPGTFGKCTDSGGLGHTFSIAPQIILTQGQGLGATALADKNREVCCWPQTYLKRRCYCFWGEGLSRQGVTLSGLELTV